MSDYEESDIIQYWPGIAVAIIVGLFCLAWGIEGNDFFMYQYFAPKQEEVKRKVFEETKSYNQGMVQELENMEYQYVQANEDHKPALASIILHRAADYDDNKLPADLKTFITKLRSERMK